MSRVAARVPLLFACVVRARICIRACPELAPTASNHGRMLRMLLMMTLCLYLYDNDRSTGSSRGSELNSRMLWRCESRFRQEGRGKARGVSIEPVAHHAGENPICQAICPVTKFKSQSTSHIGQEGERHRGMVPESWRNRMSLRITTRERGTKVDSNNTW